ncbi:hypothetical protein C0995_006744 [Termitomyces sp. Mi166|nr:hypothetical protein C0995_006744 [Termitomyces sp. Mi166\
MSSAFTPTPASIPPPNIVIRLQQPNGLPVHIHPLNPLDFLLRAAQIYPDKVALVHPDVEHPVSYTFAIWAQRVQNLAYALIAAGIKPGDRVAVDAKIRYIVTCAHSSLDAHHGIIAARAIMVPINTRLKPHEVAYILQHSGASLILVDYEYTHLIQGTKIPFIVSNDTGRSGDPYETFLSRGREFSAERGWLGLDTDADENTPIPERRDAILPMFHASGWTFPWANVFAYATQITIRTVNYSLIWKHLLHSGVTHYCGAPTVQETMCIAGAAPTPHLISGLETIGITPVHVYGLTHMVLLRGIMSKTRGQNFPWSNDQSIWPGRGTPMLQPKTFAWSISQASMPKKTNWLTYLEMGKPSYFNDPEATAKAFRGGAFRSGDLAVWYPDGSVAIMDRSKDIIISGGENASSLAIEQELATHPHILEVTVVARSHPKWGERPMAFVVLHPQHVAKWAGRYKQFADELKKHAKARLPGFACPEWVEVVPDLPKTSTGKILKSELRKVVAKL